MKYIRQYRTWGFVLLALAAVAILVHLAVAEVSLVEILNRSPRSRLLSALLLLAVYCLKSVLMVIPLPVLYVAAGLLFPKGWAVLITYLCLLAELSLDWRLGKRLGLGRVEAQLARHPKIALVFSRYQGNMLRTCFFARLLPLPLEPVGLFFGASGMPYLPYLLFSLAGLTPKLIPFVLMANAALNPLSPQFKIALACILVILAGVALWQWRLKKQRCPPGQEKTTKPKSPPKEDQKDAS